MKLTEKEQEICNRYSAHDEHGNAHCYECPFVMDIQYCVCLTNIDDAFNLFTYEMDRGDM